MVRVLVGVVVMVPAVVPVSVLVVVPLAHVGPFRCAEVDARPSTPPLCAYERTHAPITCAP